MRKDFFTQASPAPGTLQQLGVPCHKPIGPTCPPPRVLEAPRLSVKARKIAALVLSRAAQPLKIHTEAPAAYTTSATLSSNVIHGFILLAFHD